MRTFLFICLLTCSISGLCAETFVGPGPDPACGGTDLKIVQQRGRISLIQQTVFASNRTIVEQYRPLPHNDWQITLLLYSLRKSVICQAFCVNGRSCLTMVLGSLASATSYMSSGCC